MTKDELKDVARVGIRNVLLKFEDQLGELFHEFPDAFVSPTAPVLARPELRNGHKSDDPTAPVAVGKGKKTKKSYGSSASVTARRQVSFDLLATVEHAPRPLSLEDIAAAHAKDGVSIRSILPLVRRGYLKKTAKGFARTSKTFLVDKNAAARMRRSKRAAASA